MCVYTALATSHFILLVLFYSFRTIISKSYDDSNQNFGIEPNWSLLLFCNPFPFLFPSLLLSFWIRFSLLFIATTIYWPFFFNTGGQRSVKRHFINGILSLYLFCLIDYTQEIHLLYHFLHSLFSKFNSPFSLFKHAHAHAYVLTHIHTQTLKRHHSLNKSLCMGLWKTQFFVFLYLESFFIQY